MNHRPSVTFGSLHPQSLAQRVDLAATNLSARLLADDPAALRSALSTADTALRLSSGMNYSRRVTLQRLTQDARRRLKSISRPPPMRPAAIAHTPAMRPAAIAHTPAVGYIPMPTSGIGGFLGAAQGEDVDPPPEEKQFKKGGGGFPLMLGLWYVAKML